MPHSFRFRPPEPRDGSIVRPRLLRTMLGRWERRVTSVIGGAGLGKTTLLAQALAENRLAPRGEDVWLALRPSDADDDGLSRDLLAAVAPDGAEAAEGTDATRAAGPADRPPPVEVADAVWRRAPQQVCLVLDDVHTLPSDSPGAAWLAELIGALPVNAHVVLGGRSGLPVPVVRLATRGDLLRIGEDELRFSDEEMAGFADRHDVAPRRLTSTGGWPAMAELTASVDADLTGDYLWEEVLRPLGPRRRRVLAVVCDLGGADDALASAALGEPVDLDEALAGVPLVATGTGGWRVPHALWRSVRALTLGPERAEIRRRAVGQQITQRRYDEAFTLAHDADLHTLLPDVLRAACTAAARPPVAQLDRWLALCPAAVRSSTPGHLADALRATLTAPAESIEALRKAAMRCRADGDLHAEMVAIANLGRVAWWYQDLTVLHEMIPRALELESTDHPFGRAIVAVGGALFADLAGDDAGVLAELSRVEPGMLDPDWVPVVRWVGANVRAGMGDVDAAAAASLRPTADPNFALVLDTLRLTIRWMQGAVDEVLAELDDYMARVRVSGLLHLVAIVAPTLGWLRAHAGDIAGGRALQDEARGLVGGALGDPAVPTALAEASAQLGDGDEESATATLERALDEHDLERGTDRRHWRLGLALTYVLVPATRQRWEALELRGFHAVTRRLAATIVAMRGGAADRTLRDLDLPEPGVIRAALHHRFAAELAVGLEAAGHPGSGVLLEALGPVGRAAVRDLADAGPPRRSRPARALLAAVPAPPAAVTELAMLGPLVVRRDGEPVVDPALRRERLRALLAFLVNRRDTTRGAIMAALWPDRDERAAGNNLRVTLTYLLRLLEPWRAAGESAFHVRTSGPRVQLVTGAWLRIDVDQLEAHMDAAARAEASGTPSLALDHDLAVVDLYRGDLCADVPDAGWITLDRERYRTRFVAAATRAAQLLAARGDTAAADDVARRAIDTDPWAEAAYRVLVDTALTRGDRSTARRTLGHCLDALKELDVQPSDETRRLRRRLHAHDDG